MNKGCHAFGTVLCLGDMHLHTQCIHIAMLSFPVRILRHSLMLRCKSF